MKKITENRLKYGIILIFAVYAAILAACLQLGGDDFWWCMIREASDLFGEYDFNGRYLTNIITFYMEHYPIVRFIVHFPVMLLLFREIALVSNQGKKADHWMNWAFSATLLLTVPTLLSRYTISWVAGFTNYVFSMVLLLRYLRFCIPFLMEKEIAGFRKRDTALLLLGFLTALCIEHVTIYILMLTVFMIIISAIRFKKVHTGHILYLIGAIIGTVLMFSNQNYYSVVSEEGDQTGARFVEASFIDIVMKVYDRIIVLYAKPYFVVHILIAVSLLTLFVKKYASLHPPKYAGLCIGIVLIFAGYSVFTQIFVDFELISTKYTIRALETAFTFIYLLAIIYLSYLLMNQEKFMLICLYLISTVILTAPFVIVNPVTERCFFAEYLFWGLTAGIFLMESVKDWNALQKKTAGICIGSGILVFSCILAVMHISNKYCDILRIRLLREQLAEENLPSISVIKLPYPDLFGDTLENLDRDKKSGIFHLYGEEMDYGDIIVEAYGLDPRIRDEHLVYVDWYRYNLDSAVKR